MKMLREVARALWTFAGNVVERFHEYADARLSEELTVVEQRRRLLQNRSTPAPFVPPVLAASRGPRLR